MTRPRFERPDSSSLAALFAGAGALPVSYKTRRRPRDAAVRPGHSRRAGPHSCRARPRPDVPALDAHPMTEC